MRIFKAASVALAATIVVIPSAGLAGGPEPGGFELNMEYSNAELVESGLSLGPTGSVLDGMEAKTAVIGSGGGTGFEHKNPMVALLLSCVVPGLGEIYAGETTRGRWFVASEAAIWTGYGAFRLQESMRRDDYEEYAQIFAGAPSSASDAYLSDMGDYIRSEGEDSYNESVRSDARSLYPDDLEAQEQYFLENRYFGDEAWDWGSKDTFLEYRHLRQEASRSERNAFYMTGLAVLNRAVSAIDSAWMARRHNARTGGEPSARVSVRPLFTEGDVGGRAVLEISF
jgi:hypothetical protein